MKSNEIVVLTSAALFLVLGCAAIRPQQQKAAAPQWKNLQLLRQDIPREELMAIMRTYSRSLGVRCIFCHEGEEGRSMDFASDVKDQKRTTRVMMQMTRAINEQYLSRMEAYGNVVDCYTCHRGESIPTGSLEEHQTETR